MPREFSSTETESPRQSIGQFLGDLYDVHDDNKMESDLIDEVRRGVNPKIQLDADHVFPVGNAINELFRMSPEEQRKKLPEVIEFINSLS